MSATLDALDGDTLIELGLLKLEAQRRTAERECVARGEDHWRKVQLVRQAVKDLEEEFGPDYANAIASAVELRALRLGVVA